ncbi:MAG: hypothetical protein R3224_07690 [Balneolaceae bacterium]|nr:hypothetical protein [Balneolaceae bacterium]
MNEFKLKSGRYQWHAIIACFVIAALAGVLFRVGMILPLPGTLSLQNLRHAHSHLMFFGWAGALPLFLFLRVTLDRAESAAAGFQLMEKAVWGMLLFGLLSFPFFLLFGYHPVPFGTVALPLSVILSGMVMICWYLYIGGYLAVRRGIAGRRRNIWFEAALVMLTVSSLGAWGVAVAQALNLPSPLIAKTLTHFFLASFTEGWVVLVTVALLDEILEMPPQSYPVSPAKLATVIVLAAPLTFPYGIAESLLTPLMLGTARVAGLILGCALCLIAYRMLKSGAERGSIFIWPLAFLLLKGGMQAAASVIPSGFWLSDFALRVLYLHVLLLGGFSLTGIGYLHRAGTLAKGSYIGVAISVALMVASLLLLTRFWPLEWRGMWVYYAVAGTALLPAVAVIAEWYKLNKSSIFGRGGHHQ